MKKKRKIWKFDCGCKFDRNKNKLIKKCDAYKRDIEKK